MSKCVNIYSNKQQVFLSLHPMIFLRIEFNGDLSSEGHIHRISHLSFSVQKINVPKSSLFNLRIGISKICPSDKEGIKQAFQQYFSFKNWTTPFENIKEKVYSSYYFKSYFAQYLKISLADIAHLFSDTSNTLYVWDETHLSILW